MRWLLLLVACAKTTPDPASVDLAPALNFIDQQLSALRHGDARSRLNALRALDERAPFPAADAIRLINACAEPFPKPDASIDRLDPAGAVWNFERGNVVRVSLVSRIIHIAARKQHADEVAAAIENLFPRLADDADRRHALLALLSIDSPASMHALSRLAVISPRELFLLPNPDELADARNASLLLPALLDVPGGGADEVRAWQLARLLCSAGRLHDELATVRPRLIARMKSAPKSSDLYPQLQGALRCAH